MGSRRALHAALALLALVVLVIGALAAPGFVDWDSRRAQVARLAAERLGRPVALSGPLSFALLPQPVLEASGVLIGEGGDGLGLSTEALRLRLHWPALLLGRLDVREAELVGAEIRLPWPPQDLAGLIPPPWLTALDARLERGRVLVGGTALERVSARLLAGGAAEALAAEGDLTWRGRPIRFRATLGRPGEDGAAPLDLTLTTGGATLALRGILPGGGGFEGRLDAQGPELSAFLPSPPGAFRAQARVSAGPEAAALNALALDLGGQALSGAAALRLSPAPRLEASLAAPRLDLGPWVAALRGAGTVALPVALDLAAEAATLGPLRLRRLRGAASLEGDRLALSDITFEAPGEARIEATGASAGPRLDLALRVSAAEPRALLASLGWPEGLPLPAGAAEGRMRLSAEGAAIAASDVALRWGDSRLAGGATWRRGPRPALALGLEADSLALPVTLPGLLRALRGPPAELQLRLAAGRLLLEDGAWEGASLDAAAEGERWVVRRLAARREGVEVALSGALGAGRVQDGLLEARGPAGPVLAALGLPRPALAAVPLRLAASAAGPLDALAVRGELDLAEARIEAQGQWDWNAGRGAGGMTARHPGAARFLGAALDLPPPEFLGEGSFSLIANWQARPDAFASEGFELVAGGLRGRGQGSLSRGTPRPALSGRLSFEALPLPGWTGWLPSSWPDLDVALRAESATLPGLPPLSALGGQLRADEATIRLEDGRAAVAGGEARLALRVSRGERPLLEAEGALADLVLPGPVFGTPLDLAAGRLSAEWRLAARGSDAAALRQGLSGTARLALRDGVALGFDAGAAAAALGWDDTARAEAALRAALAGGQTALESAEARLVLEGGVARLDGARLRAEGGLALDLSGALDVARGVVDLRLAFPSDPVVALRAAGPAANPRRLPEIGAWLRRRAGAE